jgi:hypothetical protein
MEYNHELLAIISTMENTELEKRIKDIYKIDEYASRILKELTTEFLID